MLFFLHMLYINRDIKKNVLKLEKTCVSLMAKIDSKHNDVPFDCATASEDAIRIRCREKGKSNEYADFLVMAHISGMTHKEIAARLGIAPKTSREYKRKRTKEINDKPAGA